MVASWYTYCWCRKKNLEPCQTAGRNPPFKQSGNEGSPLDGASTWVPRNVGQPGFLVDCLEKAVRSGFKKFVVAMLKAWAIDYGTFSFVFDSHFMKTFLAVQNWHVSQPCIWKIGPEELWVWTRNIQQVYIDTILHLHWIWMHTMHSVLCILKICTSCTCMRGLERIKTY